MNRTTAEHELSATRDDVEHGLGIALIGEHDLRIERLARDNDRLPEARFELGISGELARAETRAVDDAIADHALEIVDRAQHDGAAQLRLEPRQVQSRVASRHPHLPASDGGHPGRIVDHSQFAGSGCPPGSRGGLGREECVDQVDPASGKRSAIETSSSRVRRAQPSARDGGPTA
jgi:hypothetical protein